MCIHMHKYISLPILQLIITYTCIILCINHNYNEMNSTFDTFSRHWRWRRRQRQWILSEKAAFTLVFSLLHIFHLITVCFDCLFKTWCLHLIIYIKNGHKITHTHAHDMRDQMRKYHKQQWSLPPKPVSIDFRFQ